MKDDPTASEEAIWTYEQANNLYNQAQYKKPPLFIDLDLLKRVKAKLNAVSMLKVAIKKDLKEKHDPKLLKETLHLLEDMENVDFKQEISRLKEKIKLHFDVKVAIDNE